MTMTMTMNPYVLLIVDDPWKVNSVDDQSDANHGDPPGVPSKFPASIIWVGKPCAHQDCQWHFGDTMVFTVPRPAAGWELSIMVGPGSILEPLQDVATSRFRRCDRLGKHLSWSTGVFWWDFDARSFVDTEYVCYHYWCYYDCYYCYEYLSLFIPVILYYVLTCYYTLFLCAFVFV